MDEDFYSDVWSAITDLKKQISSLEYRLEKIQTENEHLQNQIDDIRSRV